MFCFLFFFYNTLNILIVAFNNKKILIRHARKEASLVSVACPVHKVAVTHHDLNLNALSVQNIRGSVRTRSLCSMLWLWKRMPRAN